MIKKVILQIIIIFIGLIGVSCIAIILDMDTSDPSTIFMEFPVYIIILAATFPAIWKNGLFAKGDRIKAAISSIIIGVGIFLVVQLVYAILQLINIYLIQAGIIIPVGPFLTALYVLLSLLAASLSFRYSNSYLSRSIEANIEDEANTQKCPSCGHKYNKLDYREDSEFWLCPQCGSNMLIEKQ